MKFEKTAENKSIKKDSKYNLLEGYMEEFISGPRTTTDIKKLYMSIYDCDACDFVNKHYRE